MWRRLWGRLKIHAAARISPGRQRRIAERLLRALRRAITRSEAKRLAIASLLRSHQADEDQRTPPSTDLKNAPPPGTLVLLPRLHGADRLVASALRPYAVQVLPPDAPAVPEGATYLLHYSRPTPQREVLQFAPLAPGAAQRQFAAAVRENPALFDWEQT
jgi:hypothetical protein